MKRPDWPITDAAMRPAGKAGECFYCKGKIGDQHDKSCVMRKRTVVIEVTVRMVQMVPEDWDQNMIEFHMNGSSSCANNTVDEMTSQVERFDRKREENGGYGPCFCSHLDGRYLREATDEDEEWSGLKVNEINQPCTHEHSED